MAFPESADVVVIGGGAMGASTAWHLTELGVTDVLLVERDVLASGSTSRSAGGIRLPFADALHVEVMKRSVAAFEAFDDRFEAEIGFEQPGYLILVASQDAERFDAALAVQRGLDVPTERWTLDQVRARVPQIETAGLAFATYNPREGYATPEAVVQGYAAAASARGVRIEQSCAVTGVDVQGGRVVGVRTRKGYVRTGTVVCTAGTGSGEIGAAVGVDLPVRAEPHWIHYSPDDCGLPADLPLVVDFATGFYVHREGSGLLVSGRERDLDVVALRATTRIPALIDLAVQTSWWGDYEMSPDHNAIVGRAADPEGFLYATGFSGHGFQQCPAVGEHLAQLIAGTEPTLDLGPFSAERFAQGGARDEAFVI